ncbi:hypothetical protein ABFS82_14G238900 [Erythranthe guttata]|uniref:DUF674 domain-containing protein n=1 Tax=Erythranthe guttata TaxID=4155 RepID=A0A022R8S1_ERYGU|nr:PREDICTED: uncharacterized protein LOC105958707 [Erythranthe guttata]EYU36133.1 hypothetical protein MIMGU_mgv11b021150mg [Erythranthe guttata]|eukprot:XP_012838168.1 PREDICTED: uncharacterized protein LOC105958707 [Erythranthe guttata]
MVGEAETEVVMRLKLLIDTESKRVLFAEAGKDFVDFLFKIQTLPVGAVVLSLLQKKQARIGSLTNLYESIENLNNSYMQSNETKDALLKPDDPLSLVAGPTPGPPRAATLASKLFYKCSTCPPVYVSDSPDIYCPGCRYSKMTSSMIYVAPPFYDDDQGIGFVKDMVTYMVMDDLVVTPLSTISSISFLNKLDVKDFSSVQEKRVNFGMDEAVKLLSASLHTNNVLTDVFLNCTTTNSNKRNRCEVYVAGALSGC